MPQHYCNQKMLNFWISSSMIRFIFQKVHRIRYHYCTTFGFFFIHFEWFWCCWTIFEALNNHLWAFIRLSVEKIDSFWGRLKSVAYIRLDEKKVEHYSIHILASWKWWNNQTTGLHPKYIHIHCISFLLAFFKSRQ